MVNLGHFLYVVQAAQYVYIIYIYIWFKLKIFLYELQIKSSNKRRISDATPIFQGFLVRHRFSFTANNQVF